MQIFGGRIDSRSNFNSFYEALLTVVQVGPLVSVFVASFCFLSVLTLARLTKLGNIE